MSFPNQPSMKGTLQQLKEIVTSLQGEDHESTRLVARMEALVAQIESKSPRSGKGEGKDSGIILKTVSGAAQATV